MRPRARCRLPRAQGRLPRSEGRPWLVWQAGGRWPCRSERTAPSISGTCPRGARLRTRGGGPGRHRRCRRVGLRRPGAVRGGWRRRRRCWAPGAVPERIATVTGRRLWSVATAVLDGRPVAVVGGNDGSWVGELQIIALPGGHSPAVDAPGAGAGAMVGVGVGARVGDVFVGHGSFVTSVATDVVGGRAVAVAAGLTETVARVWDLRTGRQVALDGRGGWIRAVGFGGRAHAVVGDVDGVLRQWDLRTCMQHGPALTGHTGAISAVATGLSDGEWPVAVTGGEDGTVRLWDLTTGEQIGRAWPFSRAGHRRRRGHRRRGGRLRVRGGGPGTCRSSYARQRPREGVGQPDAP